MAGRSDGNVNTNNVVRQLLSRLDELSSIISPQPAQSDPVENEVRNVFNGNRRPPVSSITNNRCGNNNSASASAPRGQPQRTTPTRQVFTTVKYAQHSTRHSTRIQHDIQHDVQHDIQKRPTLIPII